MHCRTAGPGHAHPGGCRPQPGRRLQQMRPHRAKLRPRRGRRHRPRRWRWQLGRRHLHPHARRQPLRRRRPRHPGQLQQHQPGRRQPNPPHQRQQIPARSGHARLARRARPGSRAPLQQQLQPGLRAARPARPRLAAQLRGPPVRPPHQPADRAGRRHPHHLQQAARASQPVRQRAAGQRHRAHRRPGYKGHQGNQARPGTALHLAMDGRARAALQPPGAPDPHQPALGRTGPPGLQRQGQPPAQGHRPAGPQPAPALRPSFGRGQLHRRAGHRHPAGPHRLPPRQRTVARQHPAPGQAERQPRAGQPPIGRWPSPGPAPLPL
nr:hypothetical protein [Delftia sp. PE138]